MHLAFIELHLLLNDTRIDIRQKYFNLKVEHPDHVYISKFDDSYS